jgi:hypothetical protein
MSNKYEKKELIQLWSIIPSIKQTITSHLKSLNTKKTTICGLEIPVLAFDWRGLTG